MTFSVCLWLQNGFLPIDVVEKIGLCYWHYDTPFEAIFLVIVVMRHWHALISAFSGHNGFRFIHSLAENFFFAQHLACS